MSPRPRAPEDVVLRAALDLIAEQGVATVTVEAVAERSGVSRPTIYRQWGSRDRLIHAAFALLRGSLVEPDTGSVRDDLLGLLRQLAGYLNRVRVFPSLMEAAARDPRLARLREEIERGARTTYGNVIRRGVERGELPADVDIELFTNLVISPLVYQRIVSQSRIETGYAERVVDTVLAAFSRVPAEQYGR